MDTYRAIHPALRLPGGRVITRSSNHHGAGLLRGAYRPLDGLCATFATFAVKLFSAPSAAFLRPLRFKIFSPKLILPSVFEKPHLRRAAEYGKTKVGQPVIRAESRL